MSNEDLRVFPQAAVGAIQGAWKYAIRPFIEEHPAEVFWGVTLAVPGMYDAWAVSTNHETLSHAFHRAYEHPMYKYMCVGLLGVLAVHLCHGVD